MATVNSTEYAKDADPYFGNRNIPQNGPIGVQFFLRRFAILSGTAANDLINLIDLHPGQMLLPQLCWIECDNPGTTLTLDIGDTDDTVAADPDRYVDGVVVSAGGGFAWTGADGVHTMTPYVIQKKCVLQAKVATASSLTTGADILFYIAVATVN